MKLIIPVFFSLYFFSFSILAESFLKQKWRRLSREISSLGKPTELNDCPPLKEDILPPPPDEPLPPIPKPNSPHPASGIVSRSHFSGVVFELQNLNKRRSLPSTQEERARLLGLPVLSTVPKMPQTKKEEVSDEGIDSSYIKNYFENYYNLPEVSNCDDPGVRLALKSSVGNNDERRQQLTKIANFYLTKQDERQCSAEGKRELFLAKYDLDRPLCPKKDNNQKNLIWADYVSSGEERSLDRKFLQQIISASSECSAKEKKELLDNAFTTTVNPRVAINLSSSTYQKILQNDINFFFKKRNTMDGGGKKADGTHDPSLDRKLTFPPFKDDKEFRLALLTMIGLRQNNVQMGMKLQNGANNQSYRKKIENYLDETKKYETDMTKTLTDQLYKTLINEPSLNAKTLNKKVASTLRAAGVCLYYGEFIGARILMQSLAVALSQLEDYLKKNRSSDLNKLTEDSLYLSIKSTANEFNNGDAKKFKNLMKYSGNSEAYSTLAVKYDAIGNKNDLVDLDTFKKAKIISNIPPQISLYYGKEGLSTPKPISIDPLLQTINNYQLPAQ